MRRWKVEGRLEDHEQYERTYCEETWKQRTGPRGGCDWSPGPRQMEDYRVGLLQPQRHVKLGQVSQNSDKNLLFRCSQSLESKFIKAWMSVLRSQSLSASNILNATQLIAWYIWTIEVWINNISTPIHLLALVAPGTYKCIRLSHIRPRIFACTGIMWANVLTVLPHATGTQVTSNGALN